MRFLSVLLVFFTQISAAEVLQGHFRHNPPEMVVNGEILSGPLKEVIETAAAVHGYTIEWKVAPFMQTLSALESGSVDLAPRLIYVPKRESYLEFLGPLGFQQKHVSFLVTKGKEGAINKYGDLAGLRIGTKLGTAYFGMFDDDKQLDKIELPGDLELVEMFVKGKLDTMAILDKPAVEDALKAQNVTDYAYAVYTYKQTIGNYYGFSKFSPHYQKLVRKLNKTLQEMVASKKVSEIYWKYMAEPPVQ